MVQLRFSSLSSLLRPRYRQRLWGLHPILRLRFDFRGEMRSAVAKAKKVAACRTAMSSSPAVSSSSVSSPLPTPGRLADDGGDEAGTSGFGGADYTSLELKPDHENR